MIKYLFMILLSINLFSDSVISKTYIVDNYRSKKLSYYIEQNETGLFVYFTVYYFMCRNIEYASMFVCDRKACYVFDNKSEDNSEGIMKFEYKEHMFDQILRIDFNMNDKCVYTWDIKNMELFLLRSRIQTVQTKYKSISK